ncbi:MAG: molybdopterin-synthase adenylyltransferase MoeB [Acidobacteriota bacterium]
MTAMHPQFSDDEALRYSRHILLKDVGTEGQLKLKRARVLVAGMGGLGSPAAMYLAAAGVGHIGIVDPDAVELSNLQRQIIHGTERIGRPKVLSAQERIGSINPHVEVERFDIRLNAENAPEIIRAYDLVVDGTDNFAARYLLNDACVLLGKPYVYGSVFRFEGQASVFAHQGSACYRCLFPEPPDTGLIPSCAEAGVLGVLPGIIGSIQAAEALKLVLGTGETLAGRLLLFDALKMRFQEIGVPKNSACPVCGEHPSITTLADTEALCSAIPSVSAFELKAMMERGDRLQLIDVREPDEFVTGHIPSSILIPSGQLIVRTHELDPECTTVLICRSGRRSAEAVLRLQASGYAGRLFTLEGGMLAWAEI